MDKKQRLLTTIRPHRYVVHLTPDLENFTFLGKQTVEFTLLQKTTTITLHAVQLTITSAVIIQGDEEVKAEVSQNEKEKTVMFIFPKDILPGEKKLHLEFSGIINNELKGWYRSAYEVNGERKFMAASHFEEIGARQLFPCIDDPSAKAVFQFIVTIKKHLTVIANTLPEKTEEDGDTKTISFAPTPKMSTYPLALIVGEFDIVETKTSSGTLVRVFTTPGKTQLAKFALDTASNMLPFYEKYFGIAYPLPKLDFIAIPDFDAGAMENWGAITAREAALLIDEEKSAAVTKQWVATVIAHEISHMWFGDLVTLEWWTYLWLNEGFASYMEYFAVDALYPEFKVWEQFAMLDHNRALGLDSLKHTHPVETQVSDLEKLPENFDEISYSKGASVIYMLAAFLGEEKFKLGVHNYLKKFSYSNATTEDLWKELEKSSGKPVSDVMQAFITKPGHPVISAVQKGKLLQLSQQRFFFNPQEAKKVKDTPLWKIPFSISSADSAIKAYLMEDVTMQIDLEESDWVKLNTNEASFARVLYSLPLYKKLAKPIVDKKISSIDRMGIIRDAFDASEAGFTNTSFALQLAQSYAQEDSYIVWATLLGKLTKLANILSQTSTKESFDKYVQELLSGVKEKLGWEKKQTDFHTDILLRSAVLSTLGRYHDASVIKKAQELFEEFIKTNKKIDNNTRGVVFRIVAENGGEKEFETLKNMYIQEQLHEEKNRIGAALVSFRDPKLLEKALEFSLSDNVRVQDITRFMLFAFDNDAGKDITWDFIKAHWEYLYKKHEGQIGMSHLIEGAGNFVSLEKMADIRAFFASHPAPFLTRTISQILEQIEANVAWFTRDKKALENFFSGK